uniref:Uncharacterized protein n=1 Tax=Strigamia maritima TaxID=126957 RepID=T1J2E5_STRMM
MHCIRQRIHVCQVSAGLDDGNCVNRFADCHSHKKHKSEEKTETLNQTHDLDLHMLQELIIWKQNKVYLLTYSQHSINFNLFALTYQFDEHIFIKSLLGINCVLNQACQFEIISKTIIILEKQNFAIQWSNPVDSTGKKLLLASGDILELIFNKMSNKFDFVNAIFGISKERVTKFEFTNFPTHRDSLAFVLRQDENTNEYLWMTFFKPFSDYFWLCILITYLIARLCLGLRMIIRFHKNTCSRSAISYTEKLFLMIIVSSYTAVLYGSLTVTTSRVRFNNIQDLLAEEKINLYAWGNYFPYTLITVITCSVKNQNMWKYLTN